MVEVLPAASVRVATTTYNRPSRSVPSRRPRTSKVAPSRCAALTTAATGKTGRDGSEIPDHQVLAQTLAVGPGYFISIEGGLPITVDGQCIGGVGFSGAPAAVDRQIVQAGIDAFNKA